MHFFSWLKWASIESGFCVYKTRRSEGFVARETRRSTFGWRRPACAQLHFDVAVQGVLTFIVRGDAGGVGCGNVSEEDGNKYLNVQKRKDPLQAPSKWILYKMSMLRFFLLCASPCELH